MHLSCVNQQTNHLKGKDLFFYEKKKKKKKEIRMLSGTNFALPLRFNSSWIQILLCPWDLIPAGIKSQGQSKICTRQHSNFFFFLFFFFSFLFFFFYFIFLEESIEIFLISPQKCFLRDLLELPTKYFCGKIQNIFFLYTPLILSYAVLEKARNLTPNYLLIILSRGWLVLWGLI